MKNLPSLFLIVALVPAAYSQSVLHEFEGDSEFDSFGAAVSDAGDVNGDGYDDLIVGAWRDDNNGDRTGSARVLSGLDGSILYAFDGDSAGDVFGAAVSGAGDVNADGYADLIVGAPLDDNNGDKSGRASVFSGFDGSILYTFDGDSIGAVFGASVSGAGDVNGDGLADLIVGASGDDNNGHHSGSARVFSGFDGSILYTFYGNSPDDYFGTSVSAAGDVNRDGFDDVIVGAPSDTPFDRGTAWVYSGADGAVLYIFLGAKKYNELGVSVSGAGDVNGDGYADLIVGAPRADPNGWNSGSARVISGIDGSTLYTFNGDASEDYFGWSASGAGDVNGDGHDDLIVGFHRIITHGSYIGGARVFSGVDGSVLHQFNGEGDQDQLGASVSGAGDVNGDGFADLIVGAPGKDNNGSRSGSAFVFSGCDFCGPLGQNYCGPANLNSTGQSAVISSTGSTNASDNAVTLMADQLPQNVFGYFLNSDVQGFTPFPPGSSGNLCLAGGIGRHVKQVGNSGAAGELVIDLILTALPRPNGTHSVVAGETWNFQCWFRDKTGGVPTSNFTNGIEILFR